MACHAEYCTADQSGPEIEWEFRIERVFEIEECKLPSWACGADQLIPSAGKQTQNEKSRKRCPGDFNDELNEVRPQYGFHSAEIRVNDGDDAHEHDGRFDADTDVLHQQCREKEP